MGDLFNEQEFIFDFREDNRTSFLKKLAIYEQSIAPIMRAKGYKRINSTERTVLFTFGEITFTRSRWSNGKKTRCPLDEKLGLKKYVRYSMELLYQLSKLATMMSYRQVVKVIKSMYGIDITKDSVLKAVKQAQILLKEKSKYNIIADEKVDKKTVDVLFIEGDGVLIKSNTGGDERKNRDMTHFVIHTGSKQIEPNRYELQNKKEIINLSHQKAKDELLDYLYNHFEIKPETLLITNSDNGKGYSNKAFVEIKKALKIRRHEHFWDMYHVIELIKSFLKKYPKELLDMAFMALFNHEKNLMKTVLDTCESLIIDDVEAKKFQYFSKKLLRKFKETRSAKMRGLAIRGLGVMETQHRKITYRMKHRGMYWSPSGANTMANIILLERMDLLRDLFFGKWREKFKEYKYQSFSVGRANKKSLDNSPRIRVHRLSQRSGSSKYSKRI